MESNIQLRPCLLVCGLYTTEAAERMQAESGSDSESGSESEYESETEIKTQNKNNPPPQPQSTIANRAICL